MASSSSTPPSSAPSVQDPIKPSRSFYKNAMNRKEKFIQLIAVTGILLLSMRSVGQKYFINELEQDISALKRERETLDNRMSNVKQDLLHEASLEPTGSFASRLRQLFGDQQ